MPLMFEEILKYLTFIDDPIISLFGQFVLPWFGAAKTWHNELLLQAWYWYQPAASIKFLQINIFSNFFPI